MTPPQGLPVGLAIGDGTGAEVADVFRSAATVLARRFGIGLEFETAPHRFRTFEGVRAGSPIDAERAAREDAARYESYLREFRRRGGRVVFRTAFNAHSLYLVRERLLAVKVDYLPLPRGEILLVRDTTQGFYGGENGIDERDDEITRVCSFRRDNTHRVLRFALREAAARYGSAAAVDRAIVVCKFHLLGPRFARWVTEFARESGVPFDVWQPDTANRNLLRGGLTGRVVMVGANEWADVMHADLLARHGLGSQEERCSWTVFLHDDLEGVLELQTVHGSADDIAGRGIVNPVATLRAAAVLVERLTKGTGVVVRMEEALAGAAREGHRTPDAGGTSTTRAVVDRVLAGLAESSEPPPTRSPAPGRRLETPAS
jgi:tartrate dehydrogenase/decarboxylase/D-malate dehydrogenase